MILSWLRGYQYSWLRFDLIAGVIVWAVLVPESLACATIAGVHPVVGEAVAAVRTPGAAPSPEPRQQSIRERGGVP